MEYSDITIETLKIQHASLELALREEQNHVWKNLIRIEEIKKEKLRKKDEILRRSLQSFSN